MKVLLNYFKPDTGKFYGSGELVLPPVHMFDVHDHVRDLLIVRRLPGLAVEHSNFIVSVNVPEHGDNHPQLIIEKE
jgi:hypothetical protein